MAFARMRLLVATLWAGSLWTVALLAQMLFAGFERATAGAVASAMFRVESWLSLGCAALLAVLWARECGADACRGRALRLVLAMAACALVLQFGIAPLMAALREAAGAGALTTSMRTRFGVLHGVAALFYLSECVLAGVLVLDVHATLRAALPAIGPACAAGKAGDAGPV